MIAICSHGTSSKDGCLTCQDTNRDECIVVARDRKTGAMWLVTGSSMGIYDMVSPFGERGRSAAKESLNKDFQVVRINLKDLFGAFTAVKAV